MKEKIHVVDKRFDAALTIAHILCGASIALAIILAVQGIEASQKDAAMAETLNLDFINADPYPVQGIAYELEARIVDGSPRQVWHRHAIVADYGDTIEVRLKVITAEAGDANYNSIREHLSFMNTAGLAAPTVETAHKKVVLPDGTSADYMDDFKDEHVTYIAAGTYQFCREDWFAGKSASTLSAYISGDTGAKLVVIAPYCEVPIRTIGMLLILAVVCGLILPMIIGVARVKNLKRLQDA